MLTLLRIRNFKGISSAEIPLGETVVFVGPNNSGKTTALQALSLWDLGLRKWSERRRESTAQVRTGVTVNRRDLLAIPVPSARLLWRDLRVRDVRRENGKAKTSNVTFEIGVEGIHQGSPWRFALEFDFANEESFYCRALDWPDSFEERSRLLDQALAERVAYLPPMSGLAAQEFRKEPGELGVLIGEGRTAEVLRNLCHRVHAAGPDGHWQDLTERIRGLFKVELRPPEYFPERSELRLEFEQGDLALDISASGRGFQQTLLLLAYLYLNPRSVLLLDEPDAHLEVIRQRGIYNVITEVAASQGSQIVAASHSEVILNEAAERDVVIAFIGRPHRIDSRQKSQAMKALRSIPFDLYYQAERHGWILFLEGATDLAILRSLARKLLPDAYDVLQDPPVHYIKNNVPDLARDVFHGLKEAKSDLVGLALFDRLPKSPDSGQGLTIWTWQRREIENYIVVPAALERFARHDLPDDLFGRAEAERRADIMKQCIEELENALRITNKPPPWSADLKVTDDFLDPLIKNFYERLGLPQLMFKRNYHVLADLVEPEELPEGAVDEIRGRLMSISTMAAEIRARRTLEPSD